MRVATYNVESLFSRPAVLDLPTWTTGRPVLERFTSLAERLQQAAYSDDDKERIVEDLVALGLGKSDDGTGFVRLRQNHGRLLTRGAGGAITVVARGRADWIGWVELTRATVNETATAMTARVIADVDADVQAVIEVEDRVALVRFNEDLLRPATPSAGDGHHGAFGHVMVIDGNDPRGIDVGVVTKPEFPITNIVSHVDDADDDGIVFSRDSPEYTVQAPGGPVLVLVEHLKSKGYGSQAASTKRRRRQAARVAELYAKRRAEGFGRVVVLGDFNDTDGEALAPLLHGTDLRDISEHPRFVSDGRPGTFGNGTARDKIDWLLLSPELWDAVSAGGTERRGVWGGTRGTLFPHYPQITSPVEAASDHAALWADIAV